MTGRRRTSWANLLFTIMAAGHETTTSLISSGTMMLLDHPDEHKKLAADPTLIGNAVEGKCCATRPPIQNAFMRIADRDTTLLGDEVVEGEMVAALIGAANRTRGLRRPRPVRRRPARADALSPSAAASTLPRLEAHRPPERTGGLRFAARRFPDLRMTERPVWRKTIPTRRLERLDVTTA